MQRQQLFDTAAESRSQQNWQAAYTAGLSWTLSEQWSVQLSYGSYQTSPQVSNLTAVGIQWHF